MIETQELSTGSELINGSKEIGEVFDAIESIVADIRAGKSIAEVGVENFSKLQKGVEGYDKLSSEVKEKAKSFPTIGFHLGKLFASF